MVWQHHDLFQSPGQAISRRHRCPLVSFVDAPLVWEARRWGVARPGWGRLVERYGEWPQLRASDVVACLSDEVAHEVVRLGVPRERIVFSPTAVDVDRFAPAAPSAAPARGVGARRRLRRRMGRDIPPLPGPRHRRRRLRSVAPVGPAARASFSWVTARNAGTSRKPSTTRGCAIVWCSRARSAHTPLPITST